MIKYYINCNRNIFKIYFIFIFLSCYMLYPQQIICYGSISKYSVDSNENGGKGSSGSTYVWEVKGQGFTGSIYSNSQGITNDVSISWKKTPPGTYDVVVREKINNCFGVPQSFKVVIAPLPVSNLNNQFLCVNPNTQEVVKAAFIDTKLSNTNFSFMWYYNDVVIPTATTSSLIADKVGTFKVEITDIKTGCKSTDFSIISKSSTSISKIEISELFVDDQKIKVIILNGFGNYEYSIDGINFQDNPVFDITEAGTYNVVSRDKNGCDDEMQSVDVIFHPKFFTPNNDGINDYWKINGFTEFMEPVTTIFDRYGLFIKSLNFYDIGWDGTLNGRPLPSDDYWFEVSYINKEGTAAKFRSHFSLKR